MCLTILLPTAPKPRKNKLLFTQKIKIIGKWLY